MVGDVLIYKNCKWKSGALVDDGFLYCFPYNHNRILNFNANYDTTIFVGDQIEGEFNFSRTIKAKNGYLYGIPSDAGRLVRFNAVTQDFIFIGNDYEC